MPSMSSPHPGVQRARAPLLLAAFLLIGGQAQAADDSAFLACAELTERQARVACLEQALEQASGDAASAAPVTRQANAPAATAESKQPEPVISPESFGRAPAKVLNNSAGEPELRDAIASLERQRSGMWLITLASGQVWRQVHPKRFNLRAGEQVKISASHWGDDYRLTTERLSGFIQVARLR